MDREDLRKAMQQAQEMQIDLVRAQAELANTEISGSSNNKQVTISMSAQGDIRGIKIEPTLLAEGLTVLENNIVEAFRNTTEKAAALTKERLSTISKKIGL